MGVEREIRGKEDRELWYSIWVLLLGFHGLITEKSRQRVRMSQEGHAPLLHDP